MVDWGSVVGGRWFAVGEVPSPGGMGGLLRGTRHEAHEAHEMAMGTEQGSAGSQSARPSPGPSLVTSRVGLERKKEEGEGGGRERVGACSVSRLTPRKCSTRHSGTAVE